MSQREYRHTESSPQWPSDPNRFMNIKIEKYGNHYRADCTDLSGAPPVGTGQNPEIAIACLFYMLHFEKPHPDRKWMDSIVRGEPIVVNGETWKPDFTFPKESEKKETPTEPAAVPPKHSMGREPTVDDVFAYAKSQGWDPEGSYYAARERLREIAYGGKPPSGYQSWGDYWKSF